MKIVDHMLHNTAPNGGMLLRKVHQLRGKGDGQLRAVRLHKIIQTVTDTDALHLLRADITPGSLINFPFFHADNLAQRLQAMDAVAPTGKLLSVCLFDLLQFIPALHPVGFIGLTGLKGFLWRQCGHVCFS